MGHRETSEFVRVAEIDVERREGDGEKARDLATTLVAELEADRSSFRAPQLRAVALSASAMATLRYDEVAAAAYLRRAVVEARRSRDMPIAAIVATAFASVAAQDGDLELAARRLGATRQIRGADDLGNCDAITLADSLADALGRDRFEVLFAEGAGLSREDALALAVPEEGAGEGEVSG